MKRYGANREKIFDLLDREGGVTEEAVRVVSKETGVPEADIWGAECSIRSFVIRVREFEFVTV